MTDDSINLKDVKIIFAGLDSAGKSSAIIALRQKYNFYETVKNLKPTIKIDYSSFVFLNRWLVNVWDMGGQVIYREVYIESPEIYFRETDFLYYIIDIQNETNINESISYLNTLLKIIREQDYSTKIIVCLNKQDPEIKNSEEIIKLDESVKKRILNDNQDLQFRFFKTSIYDISSLSEAMSYSLSTLINLDSVQFSLEKIVDNLHCIYGIIYTDSGLIISDYFKMSINSREFDELISSKINEELIFIQKLHDNKVEFSEKLNNFGNHMEYLKKIQVASKGGTITLFLDMVANSLEKDNILPHLQDLQDVLEAALN